MKKLFLLFFPILLLSQNINIDIGANKDNRDKKFFSLSLSKNIPIKKLPTYTSFYVGGWESPDSASFVAINEGIKFGKTIYLLAEIGISLINHTTDNLSTAFEFNEKIGVGYRFAKFSTSLNFIHFSNGGIKKRNRGENFITLELLFPVNF